MDWPSVLVGAGIGGALCVAFMLCWYLYEANR
jgi:hypothetical protein